MEYTSINYIVECITYLDNYAIYRCSTGILLLLKNTAMCNNLPRINAQRGKMHI